MEPVNTKSLLAFIFGQMSKLDKGEIDAKTACAQAQLASQANNVLTYELKRAVVQMQLSECGFSNQQRPELRDIESKGFDNAKLLQ